MEALLMALAVASAPPELPARPPHPQWSEQPLRMAVLATSYGDAAVLEGEAVYVVDELQLRAAATYETVAMPAWRDLMTVSVSAGRQISARDRIDVEVRQGLNGAGGGLVGALTLRRTLGR